MDSSTDTAADNYEYTLNLSAAQLQQLLAERLGITADLSQQAQWFGTPVLTPSGYVDSLPVCGQTVQGTALRKALGLRSACFTVVCQSGTFSFTTRGYGHGVGMSQYGAHAMALTGKTYREILAWYYPAPPFQRRPDAPGAQRCAKRHPAHRRCARPHSFAPCASSNVL